MGFVPVPGDCARHYLQRDCAVRPALTRHNFCSLCDLGRFGFQVKRCLGTRKMFKGGYVSHLRIAPSCPYRHRDSVSVDATGARAAPLPINVIPDRRFQCCRFGTLQKSKATAISRLVENSLARAAFCPPTFQRRRPHPIKQ
jgi:hypothetical protein